MDKKVVIVTGVGGNVGQGIIRVMRAAYPDISIVGTNISSFSSGNHLCDIFFEVPYAYEANYVESIIKIVEKTNADLIIPATDFEVFYLSKHQEEIACAIVVSELKTATNYLDKYLTYSHLNKHNLPFAESYLPSSYNGSLKDIILKPRKGRGSRGIQINPKDYKSYSDDEYMIQELHKGIEITTAFYVNKSGALHGFITFERVLENGTTTHCKVTSEHNKKLEKILKGLISVSDIRGSANLQSIVTSTGAIEPFEINCRISGTNSIRSNFGFNDVVYTLQEWLYHELPTKPVIRDGIATRILMDVIYTDAKDFDTAKDNSSKYYLF